MRNVKRWVIWAGIVAGVVWAVAGRAAGDIPPPPEPVDGPDARAEVATAPVVVAYQRDAETVRVIVPRRYFQSAPPSRLMVAGLLLAATAAIGGLSVILVRSKGARSAAAAGFVALLAVVVLSAAALWLNSQAALAQRVRPGDSGKLFRVKGMPDEVTIEATESDDQVWVILPKTNLELERPRYRGPRPRFPEPKEPR